LSDALDLGLARYKIWAAENRKCWDWNPELLRAVVELQEKLADELRATWNELKQMEPHGGRK
jgi:hypothetical protein